MKKPVIGLVIFSLLTVIMLFLSIKAFMQFDEMEPMRKAAVVVEGAKILPENEGKLVLVSGLVTADGCIVSDTEFDVTVQAPRLARIVEMCQWENSRGIGNPKGFAEAVWSSSVQPDQEINGEWYVNPGSIPFEGDVFHADAPVMLGEFTLSDKLLKRFYDLPDRRTIVTDLPQSGADKNGLTLDAANYQYYYESNFGIGLAKLMDIGDVRVYFQMVDPAKLGEITVMAKQENGMLTQYQEGISYIELLYDGILSKDEVLSEEKKWDSVGAIVAVCITLLFAGLAAFNVRKILKMKAGRKT